jgi:hypothetical protein
MPDRSWAGTHCYLCGVELPERQVELTHELHSDQLTDAEEDELEHTDCPNGCWAKEDEAQRALDARRLTPS